MNEGGPRPYSNTVKPEVADIDEIQETKDLVDNALRYSLSDTAHHMYEELFSSSRDKFIALISEFNALPAEDRGKDQYDHNRPLTEHRARSREIQLPSGYSLTITLEKNGEILLATSLG